MSFIRALRNAKIGLLIIVSIFLLLSIYFIHTSDFGRTSYKIGTFDKYKKLFGESDELGGVSVEAATDYRQKIDWTNYGYLGQEALRAGPGEHGAPVHLYTRRQQNEAAKMIKEYSYNPVASDLISLDRSIPDTRHENCRNRLYYQNLPPVSVIIVYRNEYLSFLLRTVHSVVNRSPPQLLKEIILVDDASTKTFLHADLDKHVEHYRPDLIKIIRLKEHLGLMQVKAAWSFFIPKFSRTNNNLFKIKLKWLQSLLLSL